MFDRKRLVLKPIHEEHSKFLLRVRRFIADQILIEFLNEKGRRVCGPFPASWDDLERVVAAHELRLHSKGIEVVIYPEGEGFRITGVPGYSAPYFHSTDLLELVTWARS